MSNLQVDLNQLIVNPLVFRQQCYVNALLRRNRLRLPLYPWNHYYSMTSPLTFPYCLDLEWPHSVYLERIFYRKMQFLKNLIFSGEFVKIYKSCWWQCLSWKQFWFWNLLKLLLVWTLFLKPIALSTVVSKKSVASTYFRFEFLSGWSSYPSLESSKLVIIESNCLCCQSSAWCWSKQCQIFASSWNCD